jgi:hypothetical protein
MARRIAVVVSLVVALILGLTLPTGAASDFDADDVEGPLDLRWIGAWFTQDDDVRLTISFYDGFRVSALPKVHRGRNQLRVSLTIFLSGVFVRRHGRIVLFYGDFGSGCGAVFPRFCFRARVTRSSDNVLKVRFPIVVDAPDLSYEVRVFTALRRQDKTFQDKTGTLDLGPPAERLIQRGILSSSL